MRYVVLTLLALNILYLGYNLLSEKNPKPEAHDEETAIAKIRLLREGGDNLIRKQQMDEVVKNPVRQVESEESGCTAIGPFSSITQGQMVLERIEALEVPVELRAMDKSVGDFDYRVMISPATSLEVAFRSLRELQSQNIDSYVITRGQNALGISLGVFSKRDSAVHLQLEMKGSGYQVAILDIPRLTRGYWIFSREGPHLNVDEIFLESLQLDFPEVTQGAQMCIPKAESD